MKNRGGKQSVHSNRSASILLALHHRCLHRMSRSWNVLPDLHRRAVVWITTSAANQGGSIVPSVPFEIVSCSRVMAPALTIPAESRLGK